MVRKLASILEAANVALLVERRLDAVGEFFAAEYIVHLTATHFTWGHAEIRKVLESYHRSFKDLCVDVDILAETRDRVAWQRTLRGVHKQAYKGFPATGKPLVWRDMVVSRFQDGRIAEDWFLTDLAEQLLLARKA